LVFYLARPPFFSLDSDFGFDCDQELKERSRRKSLFIRHESGVWAALPCQWALVEEANKRLSKKSTKADELHVITTVLKEEGEKARDAATKAREDAAKAREEAAKAHGTSRWNSWLAAWLESRGDLESHCGPTWPQV
jgi:hypothetical protein